MNKKAYHKFSGTSYDILGSKGDKYICINSNTDEVIELDKNLLLITKINMDNIEFVAKITELTDSLVMLLSIKNERYGNSALEPLEGIKYTAEDGIKIRLTDKLKRIINSDELRKNDLADVLGYTLLLCVNKEFDNFDDLID
jgi:hypothetical protein